jgi:hypothetical protein
MSKYLSKPKAKMTCAACGGQRFNYTRYGNAVCANRECKQKYRRARNKSGSGVIAPRSYLHQIAWEGLK